MKSSFSATFLVLLSLSSFLTIIVISNVYLADSVVFTPAFRSVFSFKTDTRSSRLLSTVLPVRFVTNSTIASANAKFQESKHKRLNRVVDVNVLKNVERYTGHDILIKQDTIKVGFYERFRSTWLYKHVFQPFRQATDCNCSSFFVEKSMIHEPAAINDFDVVFFVQDVSRRSGSVKEWKELLKAKSNHNPKQKWVYGTRECVKRIHSIFPPLPFTSFIYDWSVTYHSNSTLTIPYGKFRVLKTLNMNAKQKNWAEEKEHLIAWMSSASPKRTNTWQRKAFVESLGKYLDIHIYGRGQNMKSCPSNTEGCRKMISKYKFYLAFENNCCSEYITEKFWRTLTWDVVPIVIGAPKKDYLRLAPPNSFIYADDFEGPEKLADYIKMLHSNNELYNNYFKWKESYFAVNNFPDRGEELATTTVPPKSFVYSCSTVCKIVQKYKAENLTNSKSNVSVHFDPRTSWWGGSCSKCGSHDWIRQFT